MLISTTKLCKEYKRGPASFSAVNAIDFSMDKGDFVSIIGRSGSGKTTFVSMIAGLITPSSGAVFFEGQEISGLDDDKISAIRNKFINYIPQGLSLLPNLTALDNIRLPMFLGSKTPAPDAGVKEAEKLMKKIGIAHLRNAYPKSMSGGEMRRVAISRALLNEPKLLIADEPTGDLDIETTDEIMQLLLQVNRQGTALLIVTHDLELSKYSRRTLTMSNGSLVES